MPRPAGQLALALGVVALGAFYFAGSFFIPDAAGYAQVGPGVMPRVVGLGLLVLGALLAWQALTGGYRDFDEAAQRSLRTDWLAFALVSGGLLVYGLLVERAGFVIASAILYAMVARAFFSPRWLVNLAIGFVLAACIYLLFDKGLGLSLPPGVLALPF